MPMLKYNMVTGMNEAKAEVQHLSCDFKCKFDGKKCKSKQKRSTNKC